MATWDDTYHTNDGLGSVDPGHSNRDSSQPGGGIDGDEGYASRHASYYESAHAQHGQQTAAKGNQPIGPFTPSNGCHRIGRDHVSEFARSVNMSGGVRQGQTFTSDPASGVARAPIADYSVKYEVQGQGSGDTFEARQHRRWAGRGG